jgi:hypothetical protein
MSDRERFLTDLAASLPLPPHVRDAVVEELAAHVDDEIADLLERGYDPASAEREAVRRLGPPRSLARDLARARRGSDRLLAAVGGGAWSAIRTAIPTVLLAWVLFAVATIAAMVVLKAIGDRLGLSPRLSTDGGWNTVITAAGLGVGALFAGSAAVRGAARAGWRSSDEVRGAVALVGGVVVGIIVVGGIATDQNWASVLAWCGVPIAFAAGCRFDALRAPSVTVVLLGIAAALTLVLALGAANASFGSGASYSWTDETHGYEMVGPWWQDPASSSPRDLEVEEFSSLPPGIAHVRLVLASPSVLLELRDIRLEAWRAEAPRDGWRLLAGQTAPYAVAAMAVDGTTISGVIEFDHLPSGAWAQAIATATGRDGTRYVIAAGGPTQVTFHGTVLEWFASLGR